MTSPWTIIAVTNVPRSVNWYKRLLGAESTHPGGTVFDQLVDGKGTVLLCLHHWGPSGPRGDHNWPSLCDPSRGQGGNGLLLWFVTDDFEAAWERARALGAVVEEEPNSNNGTGMRAFLVRDPDGYYVAVNEARS